MSESGKKKKNYSLSGFRILVVEDYPFMADLLSSMAREFGVGNILVADSGNEAREMIMMFNSDTRATGHIDLVITDWLMPDGDGKDLIKWIRNSKKDSIRFMPVILCSAYTSEDIVIAARDSGASEALVKPLSAKKLADRILHVIDNPRPFIKTEDFFGPDRRRQEKPYDGEDKRVATEEDIKEHNERL